MYCVSPEGTGAGGPADEHPANTHPSKRLRTHPTDKRPVVATAIGIIACLMMPIAAIKGNPSNEGLGSAEASTLEAEDGSQQDEQQQFRELGAASARHVANFAEAELEEVMEDAAASQMTYLRLSDGYHVGTANERFARPALSIAKLYIAEYVLTYGEPEDQERVLTMLEFSDDDIADDLFATYPDCIDIVAQRYNLNSTQSRGYWGTSVTSTYDIVSFLAQKRATDPESPIFTGMIHAERIAADGYRQNFGTSTLDGVLGTKWGWSSEGELHSSVSVGQDFIVAAAISGSAEDLTRLVQHQMNRISGKSPAKR